MTLLPFRGARQPGALGQRTADVASAKVAKRADESRKLPPLALTGKAECVFFGIIKPILGNRNSSGPRFPRVNRPQIITWGLPDPHPPS